MNKVKLGFWIGFGVTILVMLLGVVLTAPQFSSKPTTGNKIDNSQLTYVRARVDSVQNQQEEGGGVTQKLKVTFVEGDEKNTTGDVTYSLTAASRSAREVAENDQVILIRSQSKTSTGEKIIYSVKEKYRLDTLLFLGIIFAVVITVIAGFRGLGALVSLGVSLTFIFGFVIPQLALGTNIILLTVVTALVIGTVSLFLSHGFGLRNRIAWLAMVFTVLLAMNLAIWAVQAAKLTGFASEEAAYLQFSAFASLNFVGVVIASIVIASIGVLDDVSTSQAAVVDELHKANPSLTVWELFARSMSVGREHIASMVNSLILVYLGTSFTSFLVLFGSSLYPWPVALNLEQISGEIVSSLVVSLGLTLAVPITSFLMAVTVKKGAWGTPRFEFPKLSLTKK